VDRKWALEEHLSTEDNNDLWDSAGEASRNGKRRMSYVESHLVDVDERLRIVDATGIERTILSLTSPGIQSIVDVAVAVKVARDTNDLVRAKFGDGRPDRLSMFACLPTQDPAEAAAELRRAVSGRGAVGALINGYTNVGSAEAGVHMDDPMYAPLWQAVELGHLGEGVPFLLPRLEHRLEKQKRGIGLGSAERRLSGYFNANFYVTTSGHLHTRTLFNTIAELGVDRVMFSADYPYEPWRRRRVGRLLPPVA
jgi:2,3-dihydroxybenzoate decarboxylase